MDSPDRREPKDDTPELSNKSGQQDTSDIPPAWREQLAKGGRLVVPLRMRGLTRSVTFDRHGNRLASTEYELCSFVPMQGSASPNEQWLALDGDDVGVRVDANYPVDG